MGIFDWIFGRKKAKEQEDQEPAPPSSPSEPEINTQTFTSDSGTVGIGTITFDGAGGITIGGMQADGSSTISSGGQQVTFNQPLQEKDDGKRTKDPLVVAGQLLDHHKKAPLDQHADLLFLEALWLILEAGKELPKFKHPGRQHLAKLTQFAQAGEVHQAFDLVRESLNQKWSQRLQRNVEPLFVRSNPMETAAFLLEIKHYINLPLIQAVARQDPALVIPLLEQETDEKWKTNLLGHALLAAMDAGNPTEILEAAWQAIVKDTDLFKYPSNETWLGLEVRRLARLELEPALDFQEQVRYEIGLTAETQEDFFYQVGQKIPEKALELAAPDGSEIYDVFAGLLGCHRAGLDIGAKLEHFYETYSEYAYRPHSAMGGLLKAGILRKDAAYIEKVLEKGGPKGWQTAYFAGPMLRELAGKDPSAAQHLLATLMKPRAAGIVAGRDASASLVAGTAMILPAFLKFKKPKPIETLVLYAAIADKGPQWEISLPA